MKAHLPIIIAIVLVNSLACHAQNKWNEIGGEFGTTHIAPSSYSRLTRDVHGNVYGVIANTIFKWDGITLAEIRIDSLATDHTVAIPVIAVDQKENIYIATSTIKNSIGRGYVAKWDGNKWSELGTGSNGLNPTGNILGLAVDTGGSVYAVGDLKNTSGKYYVAKWDGTTWVQLGVAGNGLNANALVANIVIDSSNNVYVSGSFTNSFGQYYVAKWNGLSWSDLGSSSSALTLNSGVTCLTIDRKGNIYMSGLFTLPNGTYYIAKWNGVAWSKLTLTSVSGQNSWIRSLTTDSAGNLFATGGRKSGLNSYSIYKWNGVNWSLASLGSNSGGSWIESMAFGKNDNEAYATGGLLKNRRGLNYVAKWDTRDTNVWSDLQPGMGLHANGSINDIVADAKGQIYAAGDFEDSIQYSNTKYVAKWNDTAWTMLGQGASALNANNSILCMAIDKFGHIYASGKFTNQYRYCYVAKWDGNSWSELGVPPGNSLNAISYISSIAVDDTGNIYAGGNSTDANGKYYVVKWNGLRWAYVGNGVNSINTNGEILCIRLDGFNNLYIAGKFTNANGNYYVAKWDGQTWSEVGTGANSLAANGPINSICTDKSGSIYAAGRFKNSSGKYYVAKWDGTNWIELGAGIDALNANDSIKSITLGMGDSLYCAGYFTNATGQNYVAVWNGVKWAELGMNDEFFIRRSTTLFGPSNIKVVSADLAGNLYAGGNFSNSRNLHFVAKYGTRKSTLATFNVLQIPNASLNIFPNPNNGRFVVSMVDKNLIGSQPLFISMYDMIGRQVYSSEVKFQQRSDVLDVSLGLNLADGLYHLKLQSKDESSFGKVIIRR